jgi:hypothetical protein
LGHKKSPQALASQGAWLFLFYLCKDNPLPDPLVEGPKIKAKAKAERLHTRIMVGERPLGKMATKKLSGGLVYHPKPTDSYPWAFA